MELILQQTLMTKHLSPVLFREHCLPKSGFRFGEKKDEIDVFLPTEIRLSSVVNYGDEQKKVPASMILRKLGGQEINMHYSLVETTLR